MAKNDSVLEYLRAIESGLSRLAERMETVSTEMRATRQHVAGLVALQDHDHVELATIKRRLDRLERGLKQSDQASD